MPNCDYNHRRGPIKAFFEIKPVDESIRPWYVCEYTHFDQIRRIVKNSGPAVVSRVIYEKGGEIEHSE